MGSGYCLELFEGVRTFSVLTCKLIFGHSSVPFRFVPKHVSALVIATRTRFPVLATRNVQNVEVLATPGGACLVPSAEDYVFHVFTRGTEYHDPVRIKHRNPQIPLSTTTRQQHPMSLHP